MMSWRASLKANGEALGLGKITINDIVLFAVSRVLMQHPEVNSAMIGDSIRTYAHANIVTRSIPSADFSYRRCSVRIR